MHGVTGRMGVNQHLIRSICAIRAPAGELSNGDKAMPDPILIGLSDRGMMGDGVVELKKVHGWVEDAGYAGYSEVEIFSVLDWWKRSGEETLDTCIERHRSVV